MLKTALEYLAGTSEDCKTLVGQLFKPSKLLGAYKVARARFQTGDIVLVTAEYDPAGFTAMPRTKYIDTIRRGLGMKAPAMLKVLTVAHQSAHKLAKLPFESDAFWLVIVRKEAVPIMTVLFAMPYETGDAVSEPAGILS